LPAVLRPVVSGNGNPITAQCGKIAFKPFSAYPFFSVEDSGAEVLMSADGHAVMAVKKFDNYSSVYTMVPLTKELLQGLCDYAGAHVYSRTYDVFSASKGFIMLHNSTNGKKTISLPGRYDVVELLSGREAGKGISEFSENLDKQTTRIYKISETGKGSFLSRLLGRK